MASCKKAIPLVCRSNKRPPAKAKKSPVGNWLSFFHLGKSQSVSKRKLKRHPSEPNEIKSIALPGDFLPGEKKTVEPPQLSKLFFFLIDSLNYQECLLCQQLVAVKITKLCSDKLCRWPRRHWHAALHQEWGVSHVFAQPGRWVSMNSLDLVLVECRFLTLSQSCNN